MRRFSIVGYFIGFPGFGNYLPVGWRLADVIGWWLLLWLLLAALGRMAATARCRFCGARQANAGAAIRAIPGRFPMVRLRAFCGRHLVDISRCHQRRHRIDFVAAVPADPEEIAPSSGRWGNRGRMAQDG